ncbi:hypothetical protein EFA46_013375 (plasmid) [Halarchaeum sp. CBA1220]|uniref:hypothetical protein n=1 Tax=Halarchaeum sp. CBA1220 TaxID=1853682 RepID=UPI000F3A8522|nr:hypothetical protein [Halarchaeum sp. CBA1220]QLC35255.1 hypothetical protein EFA46_013375 [Halarchaeum sp. CBA1220]
MAKTVDELRNEIRVAVGRFEREISATFTKEDLAAICDALNYEIDTDSLPPTSRMRAGILARIGERDDDATDGVDRAFRKAELEAIAAALDE